MNGGLAQLGEHLLCKQRVNGSIPLASTKCSHETTFRKLANSRLKVLFHVIISGHEKNSFFKNWEEVKIYPTIEKPRRKPLSSKGLGG
jgi:hypothetical protein